ncbi:MAG: glycosyl transferase [Myxococcota bacterium]|nr:glycosyl transferase [Myxococcota bacterium]
MKYGYFDDAAREYVITTPKTPVKWVNYVGTMRFGGIVDHTGGSLLCKTDPALNRIVKYIPQLPASDFKGETLYLRVKEAGGYRLFSPFFVPTLDPYDRYECHVGLGYNRYVSEFYGIRTEVTVFVPQGASSVVRDIKITNLRKEPVTVDAIPVVEYTHFDALKQFNNADWVPQTMQSKAVREPEGRLLLAQYAFMHKDTMVNYLTSNLPVSSFESDRKRFLGDNEYGTWKRPLALEQAELGNYEALRGDNIGALLHHLGELRPGETKRLITQLGQAGNLEAARKEAAKYRDPAAVDAAFAAERAFWDGYLSRLEVESPDPSFNSMVNIHNPRQCYTTKNWSRYLSLYQLGLGERGIGFRDSSQDVLGVLDRVPEEARTLLEMLLNVQKRNGSAMHQFNPLSMVANEGDSRERDDRPNYYGDDHLWIVLATCWYLKETGDLAFLEKSIPFYEKDREGVPLESGTVLDHLLRSVAFTKGDLGKHKLPLLGFADWNDTVNLATGAESSFNANLYGVALRELSELTEALGDTATTEALRRDYAAMKATFGEVAWDGEWFIRYFDADGSPLGSNKNTDGKIYTNGQSWPVISGFADPARARTALDSVRRLLNTKNGIKLSYPGFNGFDPAKGGVTTYPPGAKENGGIFLHANPWVMIAECLLGNGDYAYEYYHQINPAAKNDKIDEFECEPYVYPQNVLGDEHPQFGLARNSWLSGTSAWTYTAATKYILGILPTHQGLKVDPCIPKGWQGYRAKRQFRGAEYQIRVQNPRGVSKGVTSLTVNGQKIDGNVIPLAKPGTTVEVLVTLG